MYILVALDDLDKVVRTYIIPSSKVIKNTQLSMGEYSSKYDIYLDRWDILTEYVNFLSELRHGTKTISK